MQLARARAIVDHVVSNASGPVSVFVADVHGELVAAVTMDGAAPDTRLNAQRKAYTAARSDATSTRELADKARADPVERASFDPFFSFFLGGVAVFEDGRRSGAVGVSGLPGDVDEQLSLAAIKNSPPPPPWGETQRRAPSPAAAKMSNRRSLSSARMTTKADFTEQE